MKQFNRSLSDSDISALLAQLKAREAEYPAALLAARRAEFLKNAASLQSHDSHGPDNTQGSSSSNSTPSSAAKSLSSSVHAASKTLSTILYAAVGVLTTIVLAEVVYLYREEIKEFFIPGSVGVVSTEVLSPPPETSETPVSPTPSPTVTGTSTNTPTKTPTRTIKPEGTPQPAATLAPPVIPTDQPGLHLGQTKTPKP